MASSGHLMEIISRFSGEDVSSFREEWNSKITHTKQEEKEARKFLKDVQNYIKSDKFINDCNERAKCTGESPKKVAKTYIGKVAGVIGDGLGIAVDTVNIGAVGLIDLIGTLLTRAIDLICNIVRGIVRTLTFNRTNHVATA